MAEFVRPNFSNVSVLGEFPPMLLTRKLSHVLKHESTLLPEREVGTRLDKIGLRPYTSDELSRAFATLTAALDTREKSPALDIPRITWRDLAEVPVDEQAFVALWGGTNQRSGIITKESGRFLGETFSHHRIPKDTESRTMTVHGLAEAIGDHLLGGFDEVHHRKEDYQHVKAMGVSLGFPILNTVEDHGIDARPNGKPSNWNLTDIDLEVPAEVQPALGPALISHLQANGLGVERVYFLHDTIATGNDVSDWDAHGDPVPVSFIGGTGTSAELHGETLDISSYTDILPGNLLQEYMTKNGKMPLGNALKYLTGGDRIRQRMVGAVSLLTENDPNLIRTENLRDINTYLQTKKFNFFDGPRRPSDPKSAELFYDRLYFKLEPQERELVEGITYRAYEQAGQVMGLMIAATLHQGGYDGKGHLPFPVAGGVIQGNMLVQRKVLDTLAQFYPEAHIQLMNAYDDSGVGKFTLVQENHRRQRTS